MTKELKQKYEKFSKMIFDGSAESQAGKALFCDIVKEEAAAFNQEFGGGNVIRVQIVGAMCEVMAAEMRQSLERITPGLSDNVDLLKEMMGVISLAL